MNVQKVLQEENVRKECKSVVQVYVKMADVVKKGDTADTNVNAEMATLEKDVR